MSEFKGTPGPWVSHNSGVTTEAPVKPNRTHGYGCSNDFVCCLNDGEYHEYSDGEEQVANARLIAASPELLEALIDARSQLEVYEREATGEAYNDLEINAAISRALGTDQ